MAQVITAEMRYRGRDYMLLGRQLSGPRFPDDRRKFPAEVRRICSVWAPARAKSFTISGMRHDYSPHHNPGAVDFEVRYFTTLREGQFPVDHSVRVR